MARPVKWRHVAALPQATYFKPAGVPLRALEDIALTVEEVEAIRLKDLEGLEQEECAERMRVSRPTFHRVLQSARRKLADALVNGKALRVHGGNFTLDGQSYRCTEDGHEWQVRFDEMEKGGRLACPRCNSPSVVVAYPRGLGGGRGRARWRGQRDGRQR